MSVTAIGKIIHLVRYRFLLFAGLLPYCLGSAISFHDTGHLNLFLFAVGLTGLFFVLAGVETFNEYFDWKLGTDRVFELDPRPVGKKTFYIGLISFGIALIFAIYLTILAGWGILFFALAGFIAAAGYLGPPLKFAYRGLGEIVIALAYGPLMVLGSYYLQSGTITANSLFISLIPAILLFNIAIINEVPDFVQDRLVGKRNLCVRLGRKGVVKLYAWLILSFFVVCLIGMLMKLTPPAVWLIFILAPLAYNNYRIARRSYSDPHLYLTAIRGTIILYIITMAIFIAGFAVKKVDS